MFVFHQRLPMALWGHSFQTQAPKQDSGSADIINIWGSKHSGHLPKKMLMMVVNIMILIYEVCIYLCIYIIYNICFIYMLILYLVGIMLLMMCFFIGFWLGTGCPIAMTLTNLWKLPAGRGTRRIFGFDGGPVTVSLSGGSLVPNGIRHGHVQAGNFREWGICYIFYECVSHFCAMKIQSHIDFWLTSAMIRSQHANNEL